MKGLILLIGTLVVVHFLLVTAFVAPFGTL